MYLPGEKVVTVPYRQVPPLVINSKYRLKPPMWLNRNLNCIGSRAGTILDSFLAFLMSGV